MRWLAAANIAALVLAAITGLYRAARLDSAEAIRPAS
jgi:hypothetical protein